MALDRLIADGRIHPSRIEEIVQETEQKIDEHIAKNGQEAADEVNVHGLHEQVIHLLGRLHFRTSYSQNVLRHSIEVAFLSEISFLSEIFTFLTVLALDLVLWMTA